MDYQWYGKKTWQKLIHKWSGFASNFQTEYWPNNIINVLISAYSIKFNPVPGTLLIHELLDRLDSWIKYSIYKWSTNDVEYACNMIKSNPYPISICLKYLAEH